MDNQLTMYEFYYLHTSKLVTNYSSCDKESECALVKKKIQLSEDNTDNIWSISRDSTYES